MLLPGAAVGDLINGTRTTANVPDISAFDLVATYDGAGALTVTGCPQYYNAAILAESHDVSAADDYSLTINAIVSPSAGTTPTSASGSIAINGSIVGGDAELLLSGTITGIGSLLNSADGYTYFDFSFLVTGGSLADAYGKVGATAISQLTLYYNSEWADTAFSGAFDSPFSYNDICSNVADTYFVSAAPVPEPCSAALLLTSVGMGLAVFASRRFWMRRR